MAMIYEFFQMMCTTIRYQIVSLSELKWFNSVYNAGLFQSIYKVLDAIFYVTTASFMCIGKPFLVHWKVALEIGWSFPYVDACPDNKWEKVKG